MEQEGICYISFDSVYEEKDQFEEVYETIVERLFDSARKQDILYAVPGHPLVAEKTVQLLLSLGESKGYEIELAGGQSFLDAL